VHDHNVLAPVRPEASERGPEQPVGWLQQWSPSGSRQDLDLMKQRDVLEHEVAPLLTGNRSLRPLDVPHLSGHKMRSKQA
jgi:hypothetical protein